MSIHDQDHHARNFALLVIAIVGGLVAYASLVVRIG